MSQQKLINLLPRFYKKFLPEFFEKKIPKETAIICSDCVMLSNSNDRSPTGIYFSKETKCCTHHPNLSNYLIGALLSNPDHTLGPGKNRVHEIISTSLGIAPLGIRRTRKYELLTKQARSAFGKSKVMVCPFFDRKEGICTIRPFWNATCSTWFCKYNAGHDGQAFWVALRQYMKRVEEVLSQYAAYKMGFEARHIIIPKTDTVPWTERDLDDQPADMKAYKEQWGKWAGKEEKFYKATYSLIRSLSREEFARIAGIKQDILLQDLEDKYRKLIHPKLPNTLKRNPKLMVEKTKDGAYILINYSPYDPFEVSQRIYAMLDFFDGQRSNIEACGFIRDQLGAEPTEELLVSLYQFRILTADESS